MSRQARRLKRLHEAEHLAAFMAVPELGWVARPESSKGVLLDPRFQGCWAAVGPTIVSELGGLKVERPKMQPTARAVNL